MIRDGEAPIIHALRDHRPATVSALATEDTVNVVDDNGNNCIILAVEWLHDAKLFSPLDDHHKGRRRTGSVPTMPAVLEEHSDHQSLAAARRHVRRWERAGEIITVLGRAGRAMSEASPPDDTLVNNDVSVGSGVPYVAPSPKEIPTGTPRRLVGSQSTLARLEQQSSMVAGIVNLLVSRGASVNHRNDEGLTALHRACELVASTVRARSQRGPGHSGTPLLPLPCAA